MNKTYEIIKLVVDLTVENVSLRGAIYHESERVISGSEIDILKDELNDNLLVVLANVKE